MIAVNSNRLLSGNTKSCGCYKKEILKAKNKTHGLSKTRIYKTWLSMKDRCYRKKCNAYSLYGGRGIKICDEWLFDFMNFYNWAMKNSYSDNLSIDRIDVNGNYEPSNCRIVSMKEQANNVRRNHLIEYKGKTQTLSQWSDEVGISSHTLLNRLQNGWSIEKALTTKNKRR